MQTHKLDRTEKYPHPHNHNNARFTQHAITRRTTCSENLRTKRILGQHWKELMDEQQSTKRQKMKTQREIGGQTKTAESELCSSTKGDEQADNSLHIKEVKERVNR